MQNAPNTDQEPAQLKFLRRLVTTLTITMIAGLVIIVALFVIRFSGMRTTKTTTLRLPDQISLPKGATASAFTQGKDWFAVVTENNEILIYNRATGTLTQRIEIKY